jgi:hypothetical protein
MTLLISKNLIMRLGQALVLKICNLEFTNGVNTYEKKAANLAALNIGVFELAFFEEGHNFLGI